MVYQFRKKYNPYSGKLPVPFAQPGDFIKCNNLHTLIEQSNIIIVEMNVALHMCLEAAQNLNALT